MSGYNDEGPWDKVKLNSPQLFVIAVALGAMFITPMIVDENSTSWVSAIITGVSIFGILIASWKIATRKRK